MLAFHTAGAVKAPWRGAQAGLKVLALSLLVLLGACAAPQKQVAAADPQSGVSAVTYRSALSGYQSARPVEPKPWRERNDAVAPKEKAQ